MTFFVTAQTAFHHCTFSFITAHFVHHCTLKQALGKSKQWGYKVHSLQKEDVVKITKMPNCETNMTQNEGIISMIALPHGRRLRGNSRRFPKFEVWGVGDGPCIRPLIFLRSTVIGCEEKYKMSKKYVNKEVFSRFWLRNGSYNVIIILYQISHSRDRERDKIESKTEKGRQKYFPGKMEFFLKRSL